jgi:Na+/melibiose symporter-like transporter
MKLNTKRTILWALRFCPSVFLADVQQLVPLILTNTFSLNETFSGAIMAADNVLASSCCRFSARFGPLQSPYGRRMPFILFGTLAAVALMMFLPLLDNSYYARRSVENSRFCGVLACLLVALGIYRSPPWR